MSKNISKNQNVEPTLSFLLNTTHNVILMGILEPQMWINLQLEIVYTYTIPNFSVTFAWNYSDQLIEEINRMILFPTWGWESQG